MNKVRRWLGISLALALIGGGALADGFYMDGNDHGSWVKLGKVTASHSADHDRIRVDLRNDDFHKLKFRVTDSPLNMKRIVVNYDNGASERLEVRENIPKGGETRPIDLQGGKRSIHSIDFWYDTKGILNGRAEVIAYGRR